MRVSRRQFCGSVRNDKGTKNASATSAALGDMSGTLRRNPTTGVITKPVGVAKSSRHPSVCISSAAIPNSSFVSRSAVAIRSRSSSSTIPPGNAMCPLWVSTVSVRRVSNRWVSPWMDTIGTRTAAGISPSCTVVCGADRRRLFARIARTSVGVRSILIRY